MADWDKKFMALAHHFAKWSKDPKKKVGAVIVNDDHRMISMGYNDLPQKCQHDIPARHIKPAKLFYYVHAEANAIYSAARSGIKTQDCTMYVTFHPCSTCCHGIIQSGIKRIVCYPVDFENDSWGPTCKVAKELFDETGIEVVYLEMPNEN
jgi:dCMP deaminase